MKTEEKISVKSERASKVEQAVGMPLKKYLTRCAKMGMRSKDIVKEINEKMKFKFPKLAKIGFYKANVFGVNRWFGLLGITITGLRREAKK